MILSHRWRFIFIKTMKTAGTSIEIVLSRLGGPNDIVTQIIPPHVMHSPRNFDGGFYNHMTAQQVSKLQPDEFSRYFKFCFERHPIDKCISHYAMLRNSPHHTNPDNPRSWEEYLERGQFPIDTEKYCDDQGNTIVDKIYLYEDMKGALHEFSLRTGCPIGPIEVFEKSGFRFGVPTVAEVSNNPAQRTRIMSAFATTSRILPYE